MTERIVDRRTLGAAFLRKMARDSAEKSDKRGAEVQAKRAARRSEGPQPVADVPDFDCVGEGKRGEPNAATVEAWWRAAMATAFDGRVKHEKWTMSQLVLAKKLLAAYGAEEMQRGIAEALATWAERPEVAEGILSPIPTINLLYGMRDRIWRISQAGMERGVQSGLVKGKKRGTMTDREAKRKERMATGEYNPKETDPKKRKGIGW